jgi:hypothetical protein
MKKLMHNRDGELAERNLRGASWDGRWLAERNVREAAWDARWLAVVVRDPEGLETA